jgi:D-3-phosphoglycerate dehydrogenase
MQRNILFIDTVHPSLNRLLEQDGWICVDGSSWSIDEIMNEIYAFTGIVIRSRIKIDRQLLDKALQLKFIARAGAGMENIDSEYAISKGVKCLNAPEGNRNAVAEHAMGMLLALFNRLVIADSEVRKGIWLREENRGIELEGKTVSIIGFGNTGSSFAKKLSSFSCRILAFDPFIKINSEEFPYVEQVEMDMIFKNSDVLSLHVPLHELTHFLVNEKYINQFEKPFHLINTSRGKVVSIKDLVNALESKKILGAALDVLEFESLSFENLNSAQVPESFVKLIEFKNVILSPHIAGWTFESHQKISEVLYNKISQENHSLPSNVSQG